MRQNYVLENVNPLLSEALNGTCTFQLPEPVSVFHAYKGFALPDEADFSQTIYTFTFPYIEENFDGRHEIEVLVHFHRLSEYGFGIEDMRWVFKLIICGKQSSDWPKGLSNK